MQIHILILCMIFCHIVDDYYLQGLLANLKQKQWWQNNAPDKLYKFDWAMALAMHSMSWAFMIMLPILILYSFDPPTHFFIIWVSNAVIHFIVDDLKANRLKINLIEDQCIHLLQVILTAVFF